MKNKTLWCWLYMLIMLIHLYTEHAECTCYYDKWNIYTQWINGQWSHPATIVHVLSLLSPPTKCVICLVSNATALFPLNSTNSSISLQHPCTLCRHIGLNSFFFSFSKEKFHNGLLRSMQMCPIENDTYPHIARWW